MANNDIMILGILFASQIGLIGIEGLLAGNFGFLIIIFGAVGLLISAGISNVVGVSFWVNMAGWALGWLQVLFALIVVIFGKRALSGRR